VTSAAGTGGAAWAEQKIPAGTAALLLATVPVWMIITSRIVDNERIRILTAGAWCWAWRGSRY
jgi:drug/metabolite transporter (DMT)-like permease